MNDERVYCGKSDQHRGTERDGDSDEQCDCADCRIFYHVHLQNILYGTCIQPEVQYFHWLHYDHHGNDHEHYQQQHSAFPWHGGCAFHHPLPYCGEGCEGCNVYFLGDCGRNRLRGFPVRTDRDRICISSPVPGAYQKGLCDMQQADGGPGGRRKSS